MSEQYCNRIRGLPHWLCSIFGHKMRDTKFVGSAYFKFAPEFEWIRKVTKAPWHGTACVRCNYGAPSLRIYADDGTLMWATALKEHDGE